jgi:hypothetical protein
LSIAYILFPCAASKPSEVVCSVGFSLPGTRVEGELTMVVTKILAVYRTCPITLVVEMGDGSILELSLNEAAEVYDLLPPLLWQELMDHYHVFQVR